MTEFINKTHRQIITYNEDIGHSYVPNLNARLLDDNGGYFIKTNSLGFRSDIEFKKAKTSRRILFFGDSNTAADGVCNQERYSDLIGKYFDAEVFNYAVSGTGTDQQYLIWKKYAKEIEADLVVIGVLVENIERNKVAFRETISNFTKEKTLTPKPFFKIENDKLVLKNSPVKRFDGNFKRLRKSEIQWSIPQSQRILYKTINLLRQNEVYKKLNEKYEDKLSNLRSFLIQKFYQPYRDYKNYKSTGYSLLKKILEEFTNSIGDIPVILMPIPTYHYYFDGAKPIYRTLFKFFNNPSKNIFVIDPLNQLKKLSYKEKKNLCLPYDKSHFSKRGHEVIAKYVKDEIDTLKIFKNSSTSHKKVLNNKSIKKHTYILGISAFYHDSAASLIRDGKIIAAAQEERFTRKKNDQSFPKFAINYCLEEAGINSDKLDAIVYYDNAYLTLERVFWSYLKTFPKSLASWQKYIPRWLAYKIFIPSLIRKNLNYKGKILHNEHHRSHLASAFFPSPFYKSAILTIDGVGEWATASIGVGENNKIKMLKEMSYPNSVGLLYSAFTQFLGFKVNSGEYKMMGLAPYGKPIYVDLILKHLVELKEDGSILINQDYFSYLDGSVMTNEKFAKLFGGPARKPETKITKREMDLASSIQKVTEKIIFNMASYTKKLTGSENLCLSGGVALNCVANGHLMKSNLFKDIWIQPASGDAGSSLGCAYDAYFSYFNNERLLGENNSSLQSGSLLGPSWTKSEIQSFLHSADAKYNYYANNNEKNKIIAKKIKDGKVVGLFLGRSEFGPRALGSRSIIGDPRNKDMQARLNLKIKFRESFRPFAPAILQEKTKSYFELEKESPYMMLVAPVNNEKRLPLQNNKTEDMLKIVRQVRSEIPAVTHVDYSARVQTVDKKLNYKFHEIIEEFNNQTGCPLVINTSFNVRGEPIVNSPVDAYRCFMNTNMDILVLENFILEKNEQNNFVLKNWKIPGKNLRKKINKKDFLYKELSAIYSKIKKINSNFNFEQKGWKNHSDSSLSEIFEIPKVLDDQNYDPTKMTEEIIKYWSNKNFGREISIIIIDLLKLSKKYKTNQLKFDEEVSDTMYEMF